MPKRDSFEIGGEVIAAGTRKTVDLPVSVLSDHTPVTLSVHAIHGRRPGPTVFVSAGIHGDEVIGIEIVRRLLRSKHVKSIRGTLLVVPIVNAFGFINRSRYLPDRRDLNRCFPGSQTGALASRLAHQFMGQVVTRCSLGIDLHSAAIHRTNLPQIRISPGDPEMRRLADVFAAPVILESQLRDGSLRGSAKEIGVDVLLFEAGEALRFSEMAVRAGVSGILRVLQSLEMLPANSVAKTKAESLFCPASKWLRAPAGGLLRTFKGEGDIVAKGDLLAAISDPFGEQESEISAQFSGIIIGRAVLPIVNEGDAVFNVARIGRGDPSIDPVENLAALLEMDPIYDEDEII